MYCTRCGVELREEDRFCWQCGTATRGDARPEPLSRPRALMLDKRSRKIAGVCAGFARYLDVDVTLVRILVLVFALATGVGFIAYLVAWILMPADTSVEPAASADMIRQTS